MIFGIKDFDEQYKNAIDFAMKHHANQMYGTVPYITHLAQVSFVLIRFGFHPCVGSDIERKKARDLIIAAILHDVVEDTQVTREEVEEAFGGDVALLVYAVSNEPGKNRRERHEKSHHKLIEIESSMILKLADRIANVENCLATGSSLIRMYRKEWSGFKSKLKSQTNAPEAMWNHLDLIMM